MEKIKTFADAFEYVNSKYIYNNENYLALSRLTGNDRTVFALKHGLLHILKSRERIKDDIAYTKDALRGLQYLAQPNEKLTEESKRFKVAMLKMVVNILSICNTIGFTKNTLSLLTIPSDTDPLKIMPARRNVEQPIIPVFTAGVSWFITQLATDLVDYDHTDRIKSERIAKLTEDLYRCMIYWFDDFWVPDFLAQIPDVMVSK